MEENSLNDTLAFSLVSLLTISLNMLNNINVLNI